MYFQPKSKVWVKSWRLTLNSIHPPWLSEPFCRTKVTLCLSTLLPFVLRLPLFGYLYFLKIICLFIYLLERGDRREKGRETIDLRKKYQLIASYTHPDHWLGLNLQLTHMPWPGIEPASLWFAGWCPTNWATRVRAVSCTFESSALPSLIF